MRLNLLYILLVATSIQLMGAHPGKGQNLDEIQVTVEMHNESLPALFSQIEEQTSLKFAYAHNLVQGHRVSMPRNTHSVKKVLDEALRATGLGYRMAANKSNSVIIYKRLVLHKISFIDTKNLVQTGSVTGSFA